MPPPFLALTAVDGRPTDCRVRWHQKPGRSEKDPQLGDWVTRGLPGVETPESRNLHLPNEILEQIIQHVCTILSLVPQLLLINCNHIGHPHPDSSFSMPYFADTLQDICPLPLPEHCCLGKLGRWTGLARTTE